VHVLRSNNVISIFFRMDEVLLNLKRGETRYSDSHMLGVDELDVWLDAVPASTSEGPVLLVGTFADAVPDQVSMQLSKRGACIWPSAALTIF